jgi:oligopeptide/dipeptide ABC transporter ATP-binding protein
MPDDGKELLLKVNQIRTYIQTILGDVKAVDGVCFSVNKGEAFGIAGESGCGKTMLALSIMGLFPPFSKVKLQGQAIFKNLDLLKCSKKELQNLRGKFISMVFQEPMTSLNPTLSIGTQITESLLRHEKLEPFVAEKKAEELLDLVRISNPKRILEQYPHQLSGGMRQRVMISIAIACKPEIIFADEPTTALDVTIQAQILGLLRSLQDQVKTSIVLITHNLGIIAEVTSRVMIMYLGKAVEAGTVFDIFDRPYHPYTKGLLNAIPKIGMRSKGSEKLLEEIKGSIPNPLRLPQGCKFHPRCPKVKKICQEKEPELQKIDDLHFVRCWI